MASLAEYNRRLRTARKTGALDQVLDLARDWKCPTTVRAEALGLFLSRENDQAEKRAICTDLLQEASFWADGAFLRVMTEQRVTVPVDVLAAQLPNTIESTRIQIVRALGISAQTAEAEGVLLGLLLGADDELEVEIAHSLAKVGSVKAVPALTKLTRGWWGSEVREAAKSAIATIQEGLVEGGLALVEDAGDGGLALGDSGGLALASEAE